MSDPRPQTCDTAVTGFILSLLIPPIGWIVSDRAITEIDKSDGMLTGRGLAVAGKTLGWVLTAFMLIGWAAWCGQQ